MEMLQYNKQMTDLNSLTTFRLNSFQVRRDNDALQFTQLQMLCNLSQAEHKSPLRLCLWNKDVPNSKLTSHSSKTTSMQCSFGCKTYASVPEIQEHYT